VESNDHRTLATRLGARRRFQRDLSAERELRRFEVGLPESGLRLDVFLAAKLRWASRARIRAWIEGGRVEVAASTDAPTTRRAGAPRGAQRLRGGDVVAVSLDAAHVDAGVPTGGETPPVEVVFEDAWLLAVAKPSGCNVHPTRRHLADSLLERVHRREREREPSATAAGGWLPSPCHRLDRDTSGVVLFARDPATRAAVGRQIEERSVRKSYLAWVRGELERASGEIDLPIGPDPRSALANRRAVCARGAGQAALTRWRRLERRGGASLLELEPVTGRTHQLRVHLAAIGHPILGDALYQRHDGTGDVAGADALFLRSLGGLSEAEAIALLGHHRLALHAVRLELLHPAGARPVVVEAPPPSGFSPR
jgi:23S rRNA pseudouridine1911/1915/1917 synthase